MTGYEVHCICWRLMGRGKQKLETYLESKHKNFYEMLAKEFVKDGMDIKAVRSYIQASYNADPVNFSPFELLSDEAKERYEKWKKECSSKAIYLEHVREGFNFIENYCIRNKITFNQYCSQFLKKHLREGKVDSAIVVYMNLIDKSKLGKLDKILLKKFLKEYNIVEVRINNPELNKLLSERSKEMIGLISQYKQYFTD